MKVFSWMSVLWIAGLAIAQAKAIPPSPAVLQTPDVTITGRVVVDESVPLPQIQVSFQQAGKTIHAAPIGRDGSFKLTLPQGDYTVTVSSLPSDYTLRTLRHGSLDLRTNPLTVKGVLQELQVEVGLRVPAAWVRVSGQVSGTERLPTFGNNLVLLERGGEILPLQTPIRMDGRFEFPRVLPGNYIARVAEAGGSPIMSMAGIPVQVVSGTDVTGLRFTVPSLIPVTGRMEVEGQGPFPYVSLFFANEAGRSFSSDIGNDKGILTAQVAPGDYRVRALSVSEGYSVIGVTKDSVDILSGILRVEPDKPVEFVVKVRSLFRAFSVSGRVVWTSSEEPAPGRVTLYTPLTSTLTPGVLMPRALSAAVQPDGTFEFPSVIPGPYLIDVEKENPGRGPYPSQLLHEPHRIFVSEAAVSGIEVRVPRHIELTGRLVVEDGGPMPRPSIDIEYLTTTLNQRPRMSGLIPTPDGTFRTILPEGAYRFTVQRLPPGYTVKSMLQAGLDALNQPFVLTQNSRELIVVLATTGPFRKVGGRVVDAPNPGGTSSVSVKLWSGITEIETSVGPNGRFEFLKVPPGQYTVGLDSESGSTSLPRLSIGDAPAGEARITVTDKDVEDLRITSTTDQTSFVGRGRVVVEGGGPMPRFSIDFGGAGGSIDPSPIDGTFQAWMRVGSIKVAIRELPKEYVLKAVTFGETNLRETELELRATDVNTNLLRIVVAPSGIPWKKVAGRLTGLENLRGEPVRLFFMSLNQNTDVAVAPNGSFEIPQVLSGTYNSYLQIGNRATRVGLKAPIVVADEDITGLELPVPRPLAVNIVSDGAPSTDPLRLWVLRSDSENRGLDYYAVNGAASGYFNSGDRLEIQRVPFGYRLKAATLGSIDLLKESIRFDDATPSQISIVLEPAPADPLRPEFSLKGRVQSSSTNPARRRVTATYVEHGHMSIMFTTMETFVRDDGSFQFDRLPAGPYEIRIVDRPEAARFVLPDSSGNGVILSIP